METEFDLTTALNNWRRQLRLQPGVNEDTVAELEGHLQDSMETLRRADLTQEEAFLIALRRLGDTQQLSKELAEARPKSNAFPHPSIPPAGASFGMPPPGKSHKIGSLLWLGLLLLIGGIGWGLLEVNTNKKYPDKKYVGRVKLEVVHLREPKPVQSSTWLETEYKIITARETLQIVVQNLDLAKRWNLQSDDLAIDRLASMVEPGQERGTDLITIEVYTTNANEAAELANAVAHAYAERRRQQEMTRASAKIEKLDNEIKLQIDKVAEQRVRMLEIMKEQGILDFGEIVPDPQGTVLDSYNSQSTTAAEERIQQLKAQLNTLKTLQGDSWIEATSRMLEADLSMVGSHPKLHTFRAELKALEAKGLGANHPRVLAVRNQMSALEESLNAMAEGVQKSLEAKIQFEEATLAELKKQGKEDRPELLEDKVNATMPQSPVLFHENAYPGEAISRPGLSLSFALKAGLVSLGLLLLLLWLIFRPRSASVLT